MSLVAHWPLGDSGGTDAAFGNYNADPYGSGLNVVNGIVGTATDFNGSDDQYALPLSYSSSGALPQMSVAAWVKVPSGGGDWAILDFDRSEYFTASVDDNNTSGPVFFATTTSSGSIQDFSGNTDIHDNNWHHVVWTFNADATNDKKIYIDGELDAQTSQHGGEAIGSGTTRYGFIGNGSEASSQNGSANVSWYEGLASQVRYYDHELSKAEVKELAQGKLLHYKLDSPDVISDSTIGQNTGTNNGATFVEDTAIGSGAYDFQSSDSITTQKGYQVNDHTLSFWIKQESSIDSSYESLIKNGTGNSSSPGGRLPEVFINNSGNGSLHWRWSTDTDANDGLDTPAGTLELNNWVHLVGVKEGSEYRIYKNGSQLDSVGLSSSGAGTDYGDFAIRNESSNSVQYKLDDIRFYARPISESQVQDLYETKARLDENHRFFGHQLQENNIRYEWYDTQTYYDNNSHATSASQLDEFFDPSNSGVNVGGSGIHENSVAWGDGGQAPNSKPSYLPSDGFSWKVDGSIYVPETGTYTFGVDSDDASDVFINGTQVASFYGGHGFNGNFNNNGTIDLQKGNHSFRARMEEGGGGDGIHVAWQKPSDSSFSTVPQENYLHGPSVKSTGTVESVFSEVGPAAGSLVGWWDFDRGDGTDKTGNRDGTFFQGVGFKRDVTNGRALNVSGTNGGFMRAEPFGTFSSYTVSLWAYVRDVSTGGFLISTWENNEISIRTNGSLNFFQGDNSGSRANTYYSINNNQWYHIVGKWNGSEIELYVDGISRGTSSISTMENGGSNDGFQIGKHAYGADRGTQARIDDVRVYDRALTDEEVDVLYEMSGPDAKMKKRPEGFYAPQFSETDL